MKPKPVERTTRMSLDPPGRTCACCGSIGRAVRRMDIEKMGGVVTTLCRPCLRFLVVNDFTPWLRDDLECWKVRGATS